MLSTETSLLSYLTETLPAARPSVQEVDAYAYVIMHHERRSDESLSICRQEAELQLWLTRPSASRRNKPKRA